MPTSLVSLKALKSYRYAGTKHHPGDVFDVTARDARVLRALGIGEDAPAPKPPAPPKLPTQPPPAPVPHTTTIPTRGIEPPPVPEPKKRPEKRREPDAD